MVLNTDKAPHAGTTIDLTSWANKALGIPGVSIAVAVRDRDLQVWCWGEHCPDAPRVMARLSQAIHQDCPLPNPAPPIERVCLYGRSMEAPAGDTPPFETPDWTVRFTVDSPHSSTQTAPARPSPDAAGEPKPQSRGKKRDKKTIIETVERALQDISTDVWISVKRLERQSGGRRLWIACESAYAPDAALLAQPIARRLRDLNLRGFRDAVLLGQVSGESRPEWTLRVDLTPSDRTIEAWARWGDVAAITLRLNRAVASFDLQLSAVLKDSTLHLVCSPLHYGQLTLETFPSREAVMEKLSAVLQSLAPRGILGATIYAVDIPYEASFPQPKTPVWVAWEDLPARQRPDLVPSALELARGGSLSALTFILERLLNHSLSEKLATGGIRIQIRRKGALLHVMSEGLTCPVQTEISPKIVKFLSQLELSNLSGVRIYGRRSGQRKPRWHYGVDFAPTPEQTPEVPEFQPLDSTPLDFGDSVLDAPEEGDASAVVGRSPSLSFSDWLCRTSLFRPRASLPQSTTTDLPQRAQVAVPTLVVWGLLGLVLTVQVDWLASEGLQRRQRAIAPPPSLEIEPPDEDLEFEYDIHLPELSEAEDFPEDTFDPSGFTAPTGQPQVVAARTGEVRLIREPEIEFASFNSEQMDRQLALYREYVEEGGVPDILVVGSSRALRGIHPTVLQEQLQQEGYPPLRVFNLGINGATAQVVNLLLREIIPPDRLPQTIIWADGARAFNSGREDLTYEAIVRSPGYQQIQRGFRPIESSLEAEPQVRERSLFERVSDRYQALDEQLREWVAHYSAAYPQRDELKDWVSEVLGDRPRPEPPVTPETARLPANEPLLHDNGFLAFPQRFNLQEYYQNHSRVSGAYDADYANFQLPGLQAIALRSILEFSQLQDLNLIFVNLPLTDDYLDPVRLEHEEVFVQSLLDASQQYEFVFRNFAQLWSDQHGYFSDPSHLNRYGAVAVSQRLAKSPTINWTP
ncbi:MAG: hypothetical protein JJU32_12055 [Phormidium sp. BM_Day4_Bin.17]|nr:hypothetical protein [Phormidium sp. BM_Day4_Bin.17]UCJ10496.1 MAG: hypothetical protein JWS08_11545 [Phormidium sp. PBR-2020]